jgi:glycosyltransferase involved in cell wall biosynthesis
VPRFSVIIPTKNRVNYVREAVNSVLAQSLADFELLVVNDGDPFSLDIADHRIKLLDAGGKGAAAARNLALFKAHGEFIAYLDDDDWWTDPNHLTRAANQLKNHKFFFADGTMRHMDGSPDQPFCQNASAESLRSDNTILMSTICYASSLHKELGTFDTTLPYYYDWDWYLRVAKAGHLFQRHAGPVVAIRVHAQNESGATKIPERRANLDRLAAKHGLGKIPLKNHTDFLKKNSTQ